MKCAKLDLLPANLAQRQVNGQKWPSPGRSLLETYRSGHEHVSPAKLVLGPEEDPRLFLLESDLQRSAILIFQAGDDRDSRGKGILAARDIDVVPPEPTAVGSRCGRCLLGIHRQSDQDERDDEKRNLFFHFRSFR